MQHYLYKFTTVDLFFPLAYSFFFAFLLADILKKKQLTNSKFKYFILFPFLPMIFDYLENISTIFLLNSKHIDEFLLYFLNIASSLKWFTAFIGLVILLYLILFKGKKLL